MTRIFETIKGAFSRRIAYRNTLNTLRGLPLRSRLDFDIAGIEPRVAHRAVYG